MSEQTTEDLESLILKLRELHQMDIYTVNEYWCIQLFELDVCANDYSVQPCVEFQCIYENSNTKLLKVLKDAYEWALERIRQGN